MIFYCTQYVRWSTVVWQEWQAHVTATAAEVGGPALLTCAAPVSLRDHATVAAWYRDESVVSAGDQLSKYKVEQFKLNNTIDTFMLKVT